MDLLMKSNGAGEEKPEVSLSEAAAKKTKKKRSEKRKKNLMGLEEDAANGNGAERSENPKAEKTRKPPIVSLSEAAAKLNPADLRAVIENAVNKFWRSPEKQVIKLNAFYGGKLYQVPFPWLKTFNESPLSTLIHVPLSHLPTSLLQPSADLINIVPLFILRSFVLWSSDRILTDWVAHSKQGYAQPEDPAYSLVAHFIVLAMVLRTKPDALTSILPKLRDTPVYQGQDKLPLIVWMMAQASLGDLSAGLYSWVHNLLPLLVDNNKCCCTPQSMDLILQFLDIMLSNPEAQAILVFLADRDGKRLIPPSSFEILLRLTFPDSSARLEATERFEAAYPLLKEVALAPERATGGNAVEQIFTFSLKLAGEGNPALAKEAAAIALRSVTENVDCYKLWDILYKDHLEASVSLLRKLVDEWKDRSPNLLSSPGDTLTVNRAINSFRLKNEKGISEGGANCSLYKEADESCKLILGRLSRESGCLKIAPITAVVLGAAFAAAGGVAGAALALCLPVTTSIMGGHKITPISFNCIFFKLT